MTAHTYKPGAVTLKIGGVEFKGMKTIRITDARVARIDPGQPGPVAFVVGTITDYDPCALRELLPKRIPRKLKKRRKKEAARLIAYWKRIASEPVDFGTPWPKAVAAVRELVAMDCDCEFDEDPEDPESTHFRRTCPACGTTWWGLHCPHDRVQNPCPDCGTLPEPYTYRGPV